MGEARSVEKSASRIRWSILHQLVQSIRRAVRLQETVRVFRMTPRLQAGYNYCGNYFDFILLYVLFLCPHVFPVVCCAEHCASVLS